MLLHETLERKISLALISWLPKCDFVNRCHVVLKKIDIIKNHTLGLTRRMVTDKPLVCS